MNSLHQYFDISDPHFWGAFFFFWSLVVVGVMLFNSRPIC